MATVGIQFPSDYGYTLLSVVSTFFVGTWLGIRVTSFRKAAKIPYPYEYASAEQVSTAAPAAAKAMDTFNRAQRGHQNFVENHASAVGALLVAGLRYPKLAAGLGAVWSVNRVLYALGYTNGGEKGRYWGAAGILALWTLFGVAGKSAWEMCN
ncbi:membrane-associated proteins in eicosanoid and glutathione metabolism [Sporormia fimetaria CBS 119925]|uniref:Membrane-associated proteins in eicosanoid and glutathione metabolism n=1 Tax=Sporormia fimetaria CBS 119925 TaxID=1340428 RepID=A0A6A6VKX7_9PLEO|nr:membrane-associated proteins in eicosanoid and glutathione metabolism [Sporormia fimetaria CBS 119925]